jgi:glycosyltransferase involved in cell wall biosynthesis
MVPPNDVEALSGSLQEYMNGEVSQALLDAARERVESEYDESVSAGRLLDYYNGLVQSRGKKDDRLPGQHLTSARIVSSVR